MNIYFSSLEYTPRSEVAISLGNSRVHFLTLNLKTVKLFSTVVSSFYVPNGKDEDTDFSTITLTLVFCLLLIFLVVIQSS